MLLYIYIYIMLAAEAHEITEHLRAEIHSSACGLVVAKTIDGSKQ